MDVRREGPINRGLGEEPKDSEKVRSEGSKWEGGRENWCFVMMVSDNE